MNTIGRNEACSCGGGVKYKKCCLEKESARVLAKSHQLFADAFREELVSDEVQIRPFHDFFPDEAEAENRVLWSSDRQPFKDEPFQHIEFYCVDPKCDCNRVIVSAMNRKFPEQRTIISVGNAFDRNDPEAGPYIDPLNPVTEDGRSLYPAIADMLENDSEYIARLKRHYKLVKDKIKSKKTHSLH